MKTCLPWVQACSPFSKIGSPPHSGSAVRTRQWERAAFLRGAWLCPADSAQDRAHEDTNQTATTCPPARSQALGNSEPSPAALPSCHLMINTLFRHVSMGTRLNTAILSSRLLRITSELFVSSQPATDRRRTKLRDNLVPQAS